MAQKVVTLFIDDLTGKESDEAQTHTIALDGVRYDIDLTPESYDKLYDALAPFLHAGRKIGRQKVTQLTRKAPGGGTSAETVRAWARDQGLEVSDRGRVPATVREAYERAH
ncbi:Lsr2 family protein [Streptomyces sp. NPDC005574]|uniref:histone-like nucleoid-structuring protein Lsr2 n=1 Tax=Streptomyces sp. NPDC005574 TaxID=3156891 RepID=UPI0033BC080F